LDPLDLEILERAFDAAWAALKENVRPDDLDSDEGLEAVLRMPPIPREPPSTFTSGK
jgi:hypothetical protein